MTVPRLGNFVGGAFVAPQNGAHADNQNPATGELLAHVPLSDGRDVDAAVAAATAAQSAWASLAGGERGRWLHRIADLVTRDADRLARLESDDTGKPLHVAKAVDIARAEANLRFFGDAASQFGSEAHPMPAAINYTLRQPAGVAACISPWNLPLYLLTWKVAPALAAGCTVVAKPSEVTPMTADALAHLCAEAGLPAGVFNLLHGTGPAVGAPLVAHEGVGAVTFTGSTRVGADIQARTAGQFKKASLELGGKNALIVFDDADIDAALAGAVRAGFSNQGQICLCGSRILVAKPLYDQFVARLVQRVQALQVGDPLAHATDIGSLVSAAHAEKVLGCIELARQEGGEILCGGARVQVAGRCQHGQFVAPTVIAGLGQGCRTNQEEIFGPVVTVAPFDGEEDALRQANATRYGLMCSLWTRDLQRAHRLAGRLQAGIVWVNCWMIRDLRTPFGGMKDSGIGREGGWEAMRFFTEPKNVCVAF